MARLGLSATFTLVSCAAYFTLMIEAIYSSETSVDFQRTTWRYIPEDNILHNHRSENLKIPDSDGIILKEVEQEL
jgi:hypothetical protein